MISDDFGLAMTVDPAEPVYFLKCAANERTVIRSGFLEEAFCQQCGEYEVGIGEDCLPCVDVYV